VHNFLQTHLSNIWNQTVAISKGSFLLFIPDPNPNMVPCRRYCATTPFSRSRTVPFLLSVGPCTAHPLAACGCRELETLTIVSCWACPSLFHGTVSIIAWLCELLTRIGTEQLKDSAGRSESGVNAANVECHRIACDGDRSATTEYRLWLRIICCSCKASRNRFL